MADALVRVIENRATVEVLTPSATVGVAGSHLLTPLVAAAQAASLAAEEAADTVADVIDTSSAYRDYSEVVVDEDDNIAYGVTREGKFTIGAIPDVEAAIDDLASMAELYEGRPGYREAVVDEDENIVGGYSDDYDLISKGANVTQAAQSSADLVLLGDSMTGGVTGETPWPTLLSDLLPGRRVYNGGAGGQRSEQIAARQGAVTPLVTVTGGQIPTNGSVAVTLSVNPLHTDFPSMLGVLANVRGTLSGGSSGPWSFTRSVAGDAVDVADDEPFISDIAHPGRTAIIWIGRNNVDDADLSPVLDDIHAMVGALVSAEKRFLILSVCNSRTEPEGHATYDKIIALNASIKAAYPRNYVDIRKVLVNAYDAGEAQDVTDFGNDVPPNSLMDDNVHTNTAGNQVIADHIYATLTARGW